MKAPIQPPIGSSDGSEWRITEGEGAELDTIWVSTLAKAYERHLGEESFYPGNVLEHDFCTRCVETGAMEQALGGYYLTEKGVPYAEYAYGTLRHTGSGSDEIGTNRCLPILHSILKLLLWICIAALGLTLRVLRGLLWFLVGAVVGYRTFRR